MLEGRVSNSEGKNSESLCDLNLLSMYWVGGCNWSATIKQECLATTQEPIENKEYSTISKIVLGVALASVALLGITTWKIAPKLSTTVEQINTNSAQEIMMLTATPSLPSK